MPNKTIGFASWEERCRKGWPLTVDGSNAESAVVFFYGRYAEWTSDARDAMKKDSLARGFEPAFIELDVEKPAQNWAIVQKVLEDQIGRGDSVTIDISTMPREMIWTVLWTVSRLGGEVRYVYHRPGDYCAEWLSRDPGRPRLVYKLAGVAKPNARTALVLTAGYDFQRARQLFNWCEPERMWIGLQSGRPFRDNSRRMDEYRAGFGHEAMVEFFEVDAYSDDCGMSVLEGIVGKLALNHNIIAASLGPKLSAIALYNLHRRCESVALAYAPSNDFNHEYSVGIGDSIWGRV